MLRYLPFILILALTIYALVDCVVNDDSDLPIDLPKGVWVVLIIVFPAVGSIAWLVVSRVGRLRTGSTSFGSRPAPGYRAPQRPPRMRPVAPDDDPDFLASLDRSASSPEPEGPGGPATGPGAAPEDEDGDDSGDAGDSDSDPRRGPSARS